METQTPKGASARPEFKETVATSTWQRWLDSDIWHSYKSKPVIVVSSLVFITLVLGAIFSPLLSPYTPFDPSSLNLMNGFTKPFSANDFTGDYFFLGTDDQGRDVFSTILFGLRISLFVGLVAVLFAMTLGVILGLLSGYVG